MYVFGWRSEAMEDRKRGRREDKIKKRLKHLGFGIGKWCRPAVIVAARSRTPRVSRLVNVGVRGVGRRPA